MSRDHQVATTDLVPPVIAAPELEADARLGERYRLIARLGRGGGGTVWRAFDEKVGEELALKLIGGGTELERWRREVTLARRIAHANVCRVYDLGEARGLRWVTMEWIEGESLRALLRRGALADPERLMRQLVDAVAAIHAAGVVHRDIKPENVVVDSSGRAVIVDFGLARRPHAVEAAERDGAVSDGAVTGHGAVMGTPRYMAPEQAAGGMVDARSDVYALGLVLDEIARGDDVLAAATTVGAGAVVPAVGAPRAQMLPPPWGPVIARCTALAADDRYPDAVAVRAALVSPRKQRRLVAGVALVAIAAAIAVVFARSGDGATRTTTLSQRRLTATAAAPTNQPTSLAVSSDGKTLAYTVGTTVVVRDVDGGREQPIELPTTPGGFPLALLVDIVGSLSDGRVVAQILDRDHAWVLWALGASSQVLVRREERMVVAVSRRGDQLAVATPTAGLVAVSIGGGPERALASAGAGERLGGLAWSPDGTRVAFVRHQADASATLETVAVAHPTTEVIARLRLPDPVDQMTAWPTDDRVVYVANEPDGAALMAVSTAGAAPAVLVRWPGEYVAQLSWGRGRLVVLRGTAEGGIQGGSVDRRGYFLNLERAIPEHARSGPLAGWATEARLVREARGDVVMHQPRAPATVLVAGSPDTLTGDMVIYHRGAAIRAVGIDGEGDRKLVELATAPAGGDLVRCAGERASPCVIAEVDRTGVRYRRFDPRTGALGDQVHRAALGPRFVHGMAVSPDGATLAVVDGSSTVALVALDGGGIEREPLARSAEAVAVAWARDGASLFVAALAGGEDRASMIRVWPGGQRQLLLHSDQLRYGRAHEAPLGNRVAVQTRELALDAWLLEGL